MPINRKPTVRSRTVKVLTDPHPEFVSLVSAGANMTPWRAIKIDKVEVSDAPETETGFNGEQIEKQDGFDVDRIEFAKSTFPSEDEVKAWLDAGGYSGYGEISVEKDHFVITNDTPLVDVRRVETEEGVTLSIGHGPIVHEPVDLSPNPEDAPSAVIVVAPATKVRTRKNPDLAAADLITSGKLSPVQKPITKKKFSFAVEDLSHAVMLVAWAADDTAFAEAMRGTETDIPERLKAAAIELAEVLGEMAAAEVESLQTFINESVAVRSEGDPAMLAEIKKEDTADITVDAEQAEKAALTPDTVEAKAEDTTEVVAKDADADTTETTAEDAEKASDAEGAPSEMAQLMAVVGGLAQSVETLTKSMTTHQEGAKTAEEAVTALQEKVDGLVGARQTSKGADLDEGTSGTPEPETCTKRVEDHRLKAVLGITRTPNLFQN